MRSTSEVIEELQEQLRAERAQNAFNCSEYEKQIALLRHDLAEAKYELDARRACQRAEPFGDDPLEKCSMSDKEVSKRRVPRLRLVRY
jgi:ribosomal protein L29